MEIEKTPAEKTPVDWLALKRFVNKQLTATEKFLDEAGNYIGGYQLSCKKISVRAADTDTLRSGGITLPPNLEFSNRSRFHYLQIFAERDFSYEESSLVELGNFVVKVAEECSLKTFNAETKIGLEWDEDSEKPDHFYYHLIPDVSDFTPS